jgi:hypothetical protein
VHGDGPDSEIFTILAATIPKINIAPVISLSSDVMYRIYFDEPDTGGNSVSILEYEILVQTSTGS